MDVRDALIRERADKAENRRRIRKAKKLLAEIETALTSINATPGVGRIAARLHGFSHALDSEEQRIAGITEQG